MTRTHTDTQTARRRVSSLLREPRGLLILPIAVALTAALAAPAIASEGLSGYAHTGTTTHTETEKKETSGYSHPETTKQEVKTTPTTTTPTPTPPPTPETTPSATPTTTPTTEAPSATGTATTPATTATSQAQASTLPFTGLDLRWVIGFGLLMVGAGASIVVVQRRRRRSDRR